MLYWLHTVALADEDPGATVRAHAWLYLLFHAILLHQGRATAPDKGRGGSIWQLGKVLRKTYHLKPDETG